MTPFVSGGNRGFSPESGKRAAVSFLQELGSAPEAACTPLRVNIWTIPFWRSTRDVNGMYKRRRLAQAGRRVRAEVVGGAAWARSSCDKRLARIIVEVASTRSGVEPRLHNVLSLSCAAGPACRSRCGTAAAATDEQLGRSEM